MTSSSSLRAALQHVSLTDARRLRRKINKARSPHSLSAIAAEIEAARTTLNNRLAAIPTQLNYPDDLPVVERRNDIANAIKNHQVVIIAGETGSGKTTQIPKICLELGRGRRGLIGHTQPRRIAARSVAERLADELEQPIGETVGYAIRFDDRVKETTTVKLMTDGILLSEMSRDQYLNAYDTIIIDEAHERSLNIDFILGYLKKLLPRRPDLKLIITSATIDLERFATHFSHGGQPAPIIEVSGRTYPVEIRYRPHLNPDGATPGKDDPLEALQAAITELMAEGPGDILCFFPSERDIQEASEYIANQRLNVEVVPLFGRLSSSEQHRVFSPHSRRRIVLATNIAETSLTVPGIRYVIDTGTARISRYSTKSKVQRLPIEPISQASANQRSGRSGREAPGVAIRLYSEQDFLSRPKFTDPEILRTNLASVILQMASMRLGNIAEFPFVQPPSQKSIRDGLALLHELGAIEQRVTHDQPRLTEIGRSIARIPVDPRLARMLVEANRLGVLEPVIIIVAALTVQDIRERPLEKQAQADQLHARFKDMTSDFTAYLAVWSHLREKREASSASRLRKTMKREFLHYMRYREWQDLVHQIKNVVTQLGWDPRAQQGYDLATASRDAIHMSLLTGLLSYIGERIGESKEFRGARNIRFRIFPGSALSKKPPAFIMAAELVETSQLWARDCASIQPGWIETCAPHLLKRQYSEPHWSRRRGCAMVYEKATLYGVTIYADRLLPYHIVDPEAARAMFIRHALIEGDWNSRHRFLEANRRTIEEATLVEEKLRRRGVMADDEALFEFYDSRIPEHITRSSSFDAWWKKARTPDLLSLTVEDLLPPDVSKIDPGLFPDTMAIGDARLDLEYSFAPGDECDGVTLRIPVPLLEGLDVSASEWLVPGLREELVVELLRTLPRALRRGVVPVNEFAARVTPLLDTRKRLTVALAESLRQVGVSGIGPDDFSISALPRHLTMNFATVDRRGRVTDSDRDIRSLRARRAGQVESSVRQVTQGVESATVSEWTAQTLGTIEETVTTTVDGQKLTVYPTLVISSEGITKKVVPSRSAADTALFTTTLTLLMRRVKVSSAQMLKGLPLTQRVAVDRYPHGGGDGLVEDARVASIRDELIAHGGPVRDPDAFEKLADIVGRQAPARIRRMIVETAPAIAACERMRGELDGWQGEAIDDMRRQLDFYFPPRALSTHGAHLKHVPRYLEAMRIRLNGMDDRDASRQQIIEDLLAKIHDRKGPRVREIRWMIEELRVSLWAQRLGTAVQVSEKKILRAIAALG